MLMFYVRHGLPTYDPDSLTETGFKQAEALVSRMKRIKPDKIFASSSTRAIQTAEPTAKALGKEIEILDWCHEGKIWNDFTVPVNETNRTWCFNHKETVKFMNSNEVRLLDKKWYSHPAFTTTNFEKGIIRVQAETDSFLESLGYRHEGNSYKAIKPNDDRVALFAHQGFGLVFLSCVLDIPFPQFCTHFDMSFTGVTAIEFRGEDTVVPRILQLSNDSHLFANDLQTFYNSIYEF